MNKLNGEVSIDLGGRSYKLRLGIAQIIAIEDRLGASIIEVGARLGASAPRVGDIAAILAGGFAGGGMDKQDADDLALEAIKAGKTSLVGDLFNATFPAETGGDKEKASGE